jgi:hypothetical protein
MSAQTLKTEDSFAALPRERLEEMAAGGEEVLECYRVLRKGGANVVGEILKGQGEFLEWDHYPKGDVYDGETHAQYYYHAHRGSENEHGHFHTFLRQAGMPPGVKPVPYDGKEEWPKGKDALCHLVAVSMDQYGFPTRLFTTNRWVTGETWYPGRDVMAMLDRFLIDHAYPSWPANRWLSAMFKLFRPQIVELIEGRDRALAEWSGKYPDRDVYEDRDLEITSVREISVEEQISLVDKALA